MALRYTVVFSKTAERQLDRIPDKVAKSLVEAAEALEENPRPRGCVKLKGMEGFRIRKGDYRIIYNITDSILTVLVVEVGHRKDIYRG
jgi:mRNA interferase RelE/StbE